MEDQAVTGTRQTAEAQVAAANTEAANSFFNPSAPSAEGNVDTAAANAAALTAINEPSAPAVVDAPLASTEPVEKPNLAERIEEYLKSEIEAGEHAVSQYFQIHFRRHACGNHSVDIQPTGRAGDITSFSVKE